MSFDRTTTIQIVGTTLLCVLSAVVAWPLGGNLPFIRTLIGAFTVVLLLLAITELWVSKTRQKLPLAWIFIALGLGYACLQQVTFQPVSHRFSSQHNETNGNQADDGSVELVTPSIEAVYQSSRYGTISYYPAASRERLAELSFLVAIFLAASCLVNSRKSVYALLMTIAMTGLAFTFFGIIQRLTWNEKLYWVLDVPPGAAPFGPLINRNHAGGFLLACLSAAIGLISFQYFRWNPRRAPESGMRTEWDDTETLIARKWYYGFLEFLAALEPKHLYSYAAVVLIAVGIGLTLSRGAILGLGVTIIAAMLVMSVANRYVLAILSIVVAAGGGLLVWLEQSDSILGRVETLADLKTAGAPRFEHWVNVMPYIKEHFILGSGLGTYRYLQAPFQIKFFEATFEHAENVYLETIAELGVIGIATLLGFLFACGWASLRLLGRNSVLDRSVGVAGITCLSGQIVASCFDFGVYLPANGVVIGALLGMVVSRGLSNPEITIEEAPSSPPGIFPLMAKTGLLLASGMLVCLGIRESIGVESLRLAKAELKAYKTSLGEDEPRLDEALASLQRAESIRPDDAELDFQWGEYEVSRFRQRHTRSFIRLATQVVAEDPGDSNGNPLAGYSKQEIWTNTSLTSIHRLFRFAERNNPEMLAEIKSNEHLKFLKQAWTHYISADQKCSFLPKTQFRLAQLSIFFDPANETRHLKTALARTSPDSMLLFEAGLLALHSGDQELATELWGQCLSHTKRFEQEIIQSAQFELPMKKLFEKILPQDPEYLLDISNKYFYEGKRTVPNDLLLIHTRRLLETIDIPDDQRLAIRAEIEQRLGNFEAATEFYRLALGFNPQDVQCRINYAICLEQTQEYDEAVAQLKICELEPGQHHATITKLLQKIRTERTRAVQ